MEFKCGLFNKAFWIRFIISQEFPFHLRLCLRFLIRWYSSS
ncbi:unnamed protein product, partial [Brassica oleracea var. botrytis]